MWLDGRGRRSDALVEGVDEHGRGGGEMVERERLIPAHGGYRKLKSFQIAQLVYDVTARFCDRYVERRSRTRDQMVQAARSGAQNIAEGSQASGTSKKFELKLTSVARASLEELRLDYEDFLRQRGLAPWPAEHPALMRFKAKRCATLEQVQDWVRQERERARAQTRTDTDEHGLARTDPSVDVRAHFNSDRGQRRSVAAEFVLSPARPAVAGARGRFRARRRLLRAPLQSAPPEPKPAVNAGDSPLRALAMGFFGLYRVEPCR